MKVFSIILLCAFAGMAVFGAFALLQHAGTHQIGCLAQTAAGGSVCPDAAGSAEMAAFYVSVLKSFSAAIVAAWAGFLLLALAARAALARAAFPIPPLHAFVPLRARRARALTAARFTRWLAIRERRIPPLS